MKRTGGMANFRSQPATAAGRAARFVRSQAFERETRPARGRGPLVWGQSGVGFATLFGQGGPKSP